MDVRREVRPLEYEVVSFAGREVETITVVAEHRAIGFSLAAAKANDPTDVAAALASEAVGGNDVLELWISVIGEQEVDVTKNYGGITVDLHDEPIWPWEAMPRRPAP